MQEITFSTIGDCCVDNFVNERKTFLGGTAFNVAYHAVKAGATVSLISSVGNDAYGKAYADACRATHISTTFLTTQVGNTSSVDIVHDTESGVQFVNWDIGVLKHRKLTTDEKTFLQTQDIARAVLYKPVRTMFEEFCVTPFPNTLKVGDFLGSSDYSYRTSPIKKYAPMLDIIIKSVEGNETKTLGFLQAVAKEYSKIVIGLLGSKGSVVFTKEKSYIQKAIPTAVVNTTGAGDTYQAYFCYWYKKTKNIEKAMLEATKAATQTVTCLGASYQKEF